jgi:hypothetical protein
MTDNTTPQRRRNYSRPTRFPARLSTMLTLEQRREIDELIELRKATLGEVTRDVLDAGLVYSDVAAGCRAEVTRLAKEAGVSDANALEQLIDFAVRESERRAKSGRARDITIEL